MAAGPPSDNQAGKPGSDGTRHSGYFKLNRPGTGVGVDRESYLDSDGQEDSGTAKSGGHTDYHDGRAAAAHKSC